MTDSWTFNIVYTPGTVAYLLPFVTSLLLHSDARFRLVANGCLPPERRRLEAMANSDERLEFLALPGSRCRPHGEVLETLLTLQNSRPFCIMDSDIVASGPFLEDLRKAFSRATAVFSGAPVWLPDGDAVFTKAHRMLSGEHLYDDVGTSVGCTYVAVYDVGVLRETCRKFGVGFGEYCWQELPQGVRQRLIERNRRAAFYDTGKVINALLPSRCTHVPLDTLHHLGGFSFLPMKSRANRRWRDAPAFLSRPWQLLNAYRTYLRRETLPEAHRMVRRRILLRDPVRRYFMHLLATQNGGGGPVPVPPIHDTAVRLRLKAAAAAIPPCYTCHFAAVSAKR